MNCIKFSRNDDIRGFKESRIQGFKSGLDFIEKGERDTLNKGISEIERMLKALIMSSENKPLTPWPRPINLTRLSIICHHYEV
jgi:hypothetical protein